MYRLGFLLCDQPLDHLAARFGDYPCMFRQAFDEVCEAFEWVVYDATNAELPLAVTECDGYLISGSRHGAYDPLPWIEPLSAFISDVATTAVPMVGLCFGHQLIGHTLGGEVVQSDKGWGIGINDYQVGQAESWMSPPLPRMTVPVCHQDQVTALPPAAKRIAGNAHCENFVVRFRDNMIGIQGHPEFPPEFLAELVEWRHDRLSDDLLATARASIKKPHHNREIKTWIANFLGLPQQA